MKNPGFSIVRKTRDRLIIIFVLVVVILLAIWGVINYNQDNFHQRRITILSTNGSVELLTKYQKTPRAPAAGDNIAAGYEIRTGPDGQVTLKVDDGTLILITSDSTIRLTKLSGTSSHPSTLFSNTHGKIFAFRLDGSPLPAGSSFKVQTTNNTIAIQGSSMSVEFIPSAADDARTGTTISVCITGACISENAASQTVELKGGQRVEIAPTGAIAAIEPITEADTQQIANALQTIQDSEGEMLIIDISYCNNEIGGEMDVNANQEYIAITRPGCWATPEEALESKSSISVSFSVDSSPAALVGYGPTAECTPGGVPTGTYNFGAYYQIGPFTAGDHKVETTHIHQIEKFVWNEVCILHTH